MNFCQSSSSFLAIWSFIGLRGHGWRYLARVRYLLGYVGYVLLPWRETLQAIWSAFDSPADFSGFDFFAAFGTVAVFLFSFAKDFV